ncbi:MAG: ATP-binding protein [Gemmatimonadaceae bacterium]
MPIVQTRFVSRALGTALACLAISLALTLVRFPVTSALALAQFAFISTAFVLGLFALLRQRALRRMLVEGQRVDEELRLSEAKFAGILEIAADAIITIDENERILHFNEGAAAIFGWPKSDAIGQPLEVLLPARFRATHSQHVQDFGLSKDSARRMGHRRAVAGLRRDGTEFPAQASISKLDLPGGRWIFTVVLRDITEQTRAEADEHFLVDVGAQFAHSLEVDGVIDVILNASVPRLAAAVLFDFVDASGALKRVTRASSPNANEIVRAISAYPLTWDSPSPIVDVLRRGVTEHVDKIDDAWLETHEEHDAATSLWRDLGARSLLIMSLSTGDRSVAALTLVGLGAETFSADERKLASTFAQQAALALENARLYRAARNATLARDEVLGVVSHDLRNPISAIAMCARALRGEPDAETRDETLSAIDGAIDWMQRLIQDLLDVSAIESGRLSVQRAPSTLAPIIATAMDLVRGDAAERSIELAVQLADDLPPVQADAARIVQVLTNLLDNAVKFSKHDGRITVRAHRDGNAVVVAVMDTGVGIPNAEQQHVFERYWHARRGSLRRGSGLGLAIAKGIVEAHGGKIWVESTSPGGSIFRFTLPVAGSGMFSANEASSNAVQVLGPV